MISLIVNNIPHRIDWVRFSDGALTCKIAPFSSVVRNVVISVDTKACVSEISTYLLHTCSALAHMDVYDVTDDISLHIPYFPYARADRVFEEGNPNPLHDFLGTLIDSFSAIYIDDVHNEAVFEGFNLPIIVKAQSDCLLQSLPRGHRKDWDYIIAPDKGAVEKAREVAVATGVNYTVRCTKTRDITTGRVLSVKVPRLNTFSSGKVLICDDICDGGGTFIPIAKDLVAQGYKVDLYVTHLIAAKGLEVFSEYIDQIYYKNIIGEYVTIQDINSYNMGYKNTNIRNK